MQILGFSGQNYGNKNKPQKQNFASHKLLERFAVEGVKGVEGSKYVLGNGQQVVIFRKPNSPTFINTIVRTGSMNETSDIKGEKHLTEHSVFLKPKGYGSSEYAKTVAKHGGDLNACTNQGFTEFYAQLPKDKKGIFEIIKAHAALIKYPTLPPKLFEKEKAVVVREIGKFKEDPTNTPIDSAVETVFGLDFSHNDSILGGRKTIEGFSAKRLLDDHKNTYRPDNLETHVIGDVDPEHVIKLIDKFFDTPDFQAHSEPQFQPKLRPLEQTKVRFFSSAKVKSSSIFIGIAGPENSDIKGKMATSALLKILEGFEERRPAKLDEIGASFSSDAGSPFNHKDYPSIINLQVDSEPGKEQKSLNIVKKAMRDIVRKPITQRELSKAKKMMIYDFKKCCETSNGILDVASEFAAQNATDDFKNYVANVNNISLEDVHKVAKSLQDAPAAVMVLQPKKSQDHNITFKGHVIDPKNISQKVLPNGTTLVLNNNPNLPFVSVVMRWRTDLMPKAGVKGILANMLSTSTKKHDKTAFANITQNKNIDIGASQSQSGLVFTVESEKKDFRSAVKLLREMAFEPTFSVDKFSESKASCKTDLGASIASAQSLMMDALYPNSPLSESEEKAMRTIDSIELHEVKDFYKAALAQGQISVAVSGNLDKDTQKMIEDAFSQPIPKPVNVPNVPKTPPLQKPTKPQVVVQTEPGRTQSEIYRGFDVKTDDPKEIAALEVANVVVGTAPLVARLFLDLREKQKLAYSVGSSFSPQANTYTMGFVIETDIKDGQKKLMPNIPKSLKGFQKHIDNLIKTPVSEEELSMGKAFAINDYRNCTEKGSEQSVSVLYQNGSKIDPGFLNKVVSEISKVTPADIQAVCNKYLTQPSATAIITSPQALRANKDFLKTQGDLKIISA